MTVHCRSLGGTLIIWLHIVMAVKAGFGLLPGNITAGEKMPGGLCSLQMCSSF